MTSNIDATYEQVRAEPKLSAVEILTLVREQIWGSTIMIEHESERETTSPREAFNAQTNMYAAQVHRSLLVQIWEAATGMKWPGSEASE